MTWLFYKVRKKLKRFLTFKRQKHLKNKKILLRTKRAKRACLKAIKELNNAKIIYTGNSIKCVNNLSKSSKNKLER